MNVGIMSMQRIINYGSFLQAYALKKTIESLGHEVIFVDYHVGDVLESPELSYSERNSFIKRAFRMLFSKKHRQKRKREIIQNTAFGEYYDTFKNNWLPWLEISDKRVYSPDLDVLIIGSDEVFNCTQSNPDVGFSPELFGADNNARKLITYAASFGSTTMDKLRKYNKIKEITNYLNEFDAVSVRDKNSFEITKSLTGHEPICNVDPVFIYDFNNEVPDTVDLDNYIIVYAYSGRITEEEAEAIQRFAHRNGKKTLSIGVMQAFTDEYRCVDPFKMLAYFKNADFVVTDTFHGTVFSIKYQIPFATIIRNSNREKLTDLLETFALSDRVIYKPSDINSFDLDETINTINDIMSHKTNSLNYLNGCLV